MKFVLKIEPNQKEEFRSVRQYIGRAYNDLSCGLLPYPGRKGEC
jgi:hypothetical protein